LPNDKFVFEGFLPVKKGRQTRLKILAEESRTMIFYESPHKLLKTLTNFCEYFGEDRQLSVSRELTKLYEETQRGTAKDVLEHYTEKPAKGEIVIIVAGKGK
jgi:16S rRNA (cytidine1402-2'-O)-methyltransferase